MRLFRIGWLLVFFLLSAISNAQGPQVTSTSPVSGPVLTSVQINGSGFGTSSRGNTVTFNGVTAIVTAWSDGQITATVPTTATTGPVVVTVGGTASPAEVYFNVPPPTITSISPTSGVFQTSVTVNGSGFHDPKASSSTISFGNWTATASSISTWHDNQIVALVPSNAVTGPVVVTVNGVASNSNFDFTLPKPIITSISPATGPAGTTLPVLINGSGFGATQASNSKVTFAFSQTASVVNWSDNQITVTVPAAAVTGGVQVTNSGVNSNSNIVFTVPPPQVISISPTSGIVGTTLTVNGSGFQSTRGAFSNVYVNGVQANVVPGTWSDTQLQITVPSGASSGPVTVANTVSNSNANVIFYMPNPVVTGIVPSTGPVTTPVTITGTGFGTTPGTITFGGLAGTNVTWSDTQITATVPTSATTGTVQVVQGGVKSNNNLVFTIPKPQVTSISPTSGGVNTILTINGSGFQNTKGSGALWINGTFAPVYNNIWSDTQIQVTVPATTTGPVTVTANNQTQSNADVEFSMPSPVVTSISPLSGPVGTWVTINGTGFGAQPGNNVSFNGTNATSFSSWSDSQVIAQVPTGASTGAVKVINGGVASNGMTFTAGTVTVASVSPSAGPADGTTQVTITGSGFGTTQGTVSFNGTNASSINTWNNTQIVATVPAGATTGAIKVIAGGVSSNTTVNFTVGSVVVTSVNPTSGFAGAQLTINGSGFGTAQGSVSIGPYSATVVSGGWSANQITVTPPNVALTGGVKVTAGGVASNSDVNFTVLAPTITSISPTSGSVTNPVALTINGNNFGSANPTSTVRIGGTNLTINNWSNTQISATIPSTVLTGSVVVTVGGLGSNSNLSFTVPLPDISSISPTTAVSNTAITINGSGFGSQGANFVQFYNQATAPSSSIVSWSDSQIQVKVPSNAVSGPVRVFVNGQGSNSDIAVSLPNPTVSGLSPSTGAAGTQVTVTGTGFGTSAGTISFNGVIAGLANVPSPWTDTQIVAVVPTTAGSGPVKVTQAGIASNGNFNFVVPPPQITSISPTSGVVGTQVTISGSGFTSQNSNSVFFGGGSAAPSSWTDTQIVVKIPNGAVTSPVKVTVNGQPSNQDIIFIVPSPVVTALSPTTGPINTQVTISGSGFGPTQGSGAVTFNNRSATVTSWNDTQIVATVPSTASTGPVAVSWGGVTSNTNIYFQVPAPTITSITPSTAGIGNTVTLAGSGFQTFQAGGSFLRFASGNTYQQATPISWNDSQIVATVPAGATSGSVRVLVNGVNSNYVDYIIPPNVVSSISPASGPVGTSVTVNGASFGATQGTSVLTFGGQTAASISSWSDSQIVATVPVTATTGPAAVTVNSIPSNVNVVFTVPPPTINTYTPVGGISGTQVTINGSGFQASQRDSTVTFNGLAATVSNWSDTQVVVTVPTSATTGPLLVTVNSVPSSSNNKFIVPSPVITAVTPACGPAYAEFTINGTGFGATQGAGLVFINGVQQGVSAQGGVGAPMWSDSSITIQLSPNTASGPLTVQIYDAVSNSVPFTVTQIPVISSVSPAEGSVGSTVTVTGSGFCSAQANNTLTFNGTNANVTSWSDGQIVATVPPGASTGPMVVTMTGANIGIGLTWPSNPWNFSLSRTATVADSLGNSSTYKSVQLGGGWHSESASGSGCSSCTVRGDISNTFDWSGDLLTHTDELGHVTTYTYDASANLASRTQQLDANTPVKYSYSYNNFGEPLTVADPLGNVTTNTYDGNGNLLTVSAPPPTANAAPSVTTFAYDAKGELTTITDPLGNITTLTYNPAGLIASITDAQNNVTSYTYDQHGNRTSITDAASNVTAFAYDAGDRLTTITYPDKSTVSFGYDGRGRRTSVTDQNGKTTSYAYDDADRLNSVTDAANNVTSYAYDTENNLLSITDANQHTTSFQYDNFGRVTQTSFPSTMIETYLYDAVGNLTSKTDRNNNSILYVYDALNRLTHKGYPDSTGVDYLYDLAGKIKQVTDPTGTYAMAYDNMGRLIGTTTTYTFLPSLNFNNFYTYDANSNRKSLTLPDGSTNTYQYDTLNRLSSITDSLTGQFNFGYDALSRRTSLTRPNGVNTSYGYDSLSHLLSVLHQNGTNTLDGATYIYDPAGNRTSKTNLLNNITEQYTYDPLYQLTQVVQGATTTESYSYDPVGNRLSSLGMAYNYNTSNELTSTSAATFTYDANGNTLTKINGSGTITYGWDFENRLKSAITPTGTVTFAYDAFGRRIQKAFTQGSTTTVINYVYNGMSAIEEVDTSGNQLAHYTQGLGTDEPLGELRSGASAFYEQDGLDSITSLSNSTAALANSYAYDTFGNIVASSGSSVNPYLYTGRDYDSETGLRYYRARYYDSTTGRFISEDPILSGVNFYVYATNNPTIFADPFGLTTCVKTILGMVCNPDGHPGTRNFDPQIPGPPVFDGLPQMPPRKNVPMPSSLCEPNTDCHDTIQPGLARPSYGDVMLDPCQGWDFDSGKPLLYNGPSFNCSGNRDKCLDAEDKFIRACEKAGCTGRSFNGGLSVTVSAACCHKQ